mmetsp:Transcript_13074/g.54780  ORF Transcript_13074/g.54780 Transcript_13074/m.54780 type:complete len:292 (-) Transcript_13074:397-1272(-)
MPSSKLSGAYAGRTRTTSPADSAGLPSSTPGASNCTRRALEPAVCPPPLEAQSCTWNMSHLRRFSAMALRSTAESEASARSATRASDASSDSSIRVLLASAHSRIVLGSASPVNSVSKSILLPSARSARAWRPSSAKATRAGRSNNVRRLPGTNCGASSDSLTNSVVFDTSASVTGHARGSSGPKPPYCSCSAAGAMCGSRTPTPTTKRLACNPHLADGRNSIVKLYEAPAGSTTAGTSSSALAIAWASAARAMPSSSSTLTLPAPSSWGTSFGSAMTTSTLPELTRQRLR